MAGCSMSHGRGKIHCEGCHMVSGYGVYKPWGCENDKTLFCCIAMENSPINFGLIAHKHGMQSAEWLFPEIPGWVLLYSMPSEVGYTAGQSRLSHGWQPAKTTAWCQGYRYVKGGKYAHNTNTAFIYPSLPTCDLLLALPLSWSLIPHSFAYRTLSYQQFKWSKSLKDIQTFSAFNS